MSLHFAPIFAKHQKRIEQHEQLSIYDFLKDGESQELPPSETVAQADEAQTGALDDTFKKEYLCVFPKESTEDTDSTLFSVGDTVKVRQADDVYTSWDDPEDYYHMKTFQGTVFTVEDTTDLHVITHLGRREYHFYKDEVIKI